MRAQAVRSRTAGNQRLRAFKSGEDPISKLLQLRSLRNISGGRERTRGYDLSEVWFGSVVRGSALSQLLSENVRTMCKHFLSAVPALQGLQLEAGAGETGSGSAHADRHPDPEQHPALDFFLGRRHGRRSKDRNARRGRDGLVKLFEGSPAFRTPPLADRLSFRVHASHQSPTERDADERRLLVAGRRCLPAIETAGSRRP